MDIGNKLKDARNKQKLTQEQVAECLKVSRQTISNWENEKTYPDIFNVVLMSEFYDVSLDYLLKEEKEMSNYLNYLKESTDVVRSKNHLSKILLLSTYLIIWSVSIIAFWFFVSDGEGLSYSIYLTTVIPLITFILSFLIQKNNFWQKYRWTFIIAFGIMFMLAEYLTFSTANMVAFDKFNLPEFRMIAFGSLISLIGMHAGKYFRKIKS